MCGKKYIQNEDKDQMDPEMAMRCTKVYTNQILIYILSFKRETDLPPTINRSRSSDVSNGQR